MRVVFMGTPEFSVLPLEHLVLNRYRVVAVYTRPDKAAGRGRSLACSPVKRAAQGLGLPIMQPTSFRKAETVAELSALEPDVIVVAAFGQILPQPVLDISAHGCINIHPSLLPKYRGPSPVAAAILAGDEFTGATIMRLDAGTDTGPILMQAKIPVLAQDTTGSLSSRLSLIGTQLLLEVLSSLDKGGPVPRPQNEAEASYCAAITREDGEIDWSLPAVDTWRRVRAYQPWPGCYTRWQGKQLKIIEAVPLPGGDDMVTTGGVIIPGKGETGFGVGTGRGILGIKKVQLEGKRIMSAGEFLRGQRQFAGAVLPSG